jgi:2-polyprenyl-6-methoxyphenol hydroxylase-like FAD-dependent oxidoreductase
MAMRTVCQNARVLIVGGGPVGLAMAIFLARLGHRSVVFEKKLPRESSAPKAHVLNPRSLEICRAFGIDVQALRALSAHTAEGNCARFLDRLTGTTFGSLPLDTPYDAARPCPSPTPLLNLAQPLFEGVLLRHAQSLPEIEVRRGHRFAGCASDADGVTVHIDGPEGAYREAGAYLVAADGANSAVRDFLGIAMDGIPAIRPRVTIHFEADLRALVQDRPAVLYWILDPAAHGTFICYDAASTWVYTPRVAPEAFDKADYTHDHCRRLIHAALGTDQVPVEIRHVVPWMMAAQVAERYAQGRCFLLGDAAHRFPPTGGFGLNTGIQDAHNLAWKLAAVLEGRAGEALLASYEAERQPVARINTAQSVHNAQKLTGLFALAADTLAHGPADAGGRAALGAEIETHREHFLSEGMQLGFTYGPPVQGAPDPLHYTPSLAPGARLPHAWFTAAGARRSTLDLVDLKRCTLLACQGHAAQWRAALANLPECTLAALPLVVDFESDWLGAAVLRAGGAILVRPDGHIARGVQRCDAQARAALQASLEGLGVEAASTAA